MAVAHQIEEICIWGTASLGASASGKILSVDKRDTCKPIEVADGNGELNSLILTDRRTEITAEILTTALAVAPVTGGTLTIDTTNYIIRESEISWTAGQARKFRVTAWKEEVFPVV